MTAKRAYGSGSISEVRPGVFELRWRAGRDPLTGRYIQRKERFTGTRKAAQRRLAECIAGAEVTSTATVGALRQRWREVARVTPGTMERYDYALSHVPPGLWTMRLAEVRPSTIADVYRRIEAAGVGPQTVRKVYTALSSMFTFAVRDELIASNPCRAVPPPEVPDRDYVIPTAEHLRRMIAWADSQPGSFGIWQRMVIATGVRKGELLALRWRDVDLLDGTIRIEASMRRKGQRAKAKTKASERTVVLDDLTAEALRAWYGKATEIAESVGIAVPEDGFVFAVDAEFRRTITLNSATQRQRRLSARVGCPGARVHDLRHAHATMLLEAGISRRTVADRLGHSRPSITTDLYGHAVAEADRQAADAFGRLLASDKS